MTLCSALDRAVSDTGVYPASSPWLLLTLVLVVLAGPLVMPIVIAAARVLWRLLIAVIHTLCRYAVDKIIDAIVWGAIALIGGLLFWG